MFQDTAVIAFLPLIAEQWVKYVTSVINLTILVINARVIRCPSHKTLGNVRILGTNLEPLDNASSNGIGPKALVMVSTRGINNRDSRLSIGRIHSFQWMGTHQILGET